jgi:hypothetical protein
MARRNEGEKTMLTDALEALATVGGTALVGAMATDAWEAVRNKVAHIFGRQGTQRRAAIEAQLESNADLVESAGDPGRARQALVPLWQMELAKLLEEHPDAESGLEELIAYVREALPAEQQQWVQTNIARDNSRLFAVQGGNIIYHETPSSDLSGRSLPRPSPGGNRPGRRRDSAG